MNRRELICIAILTLLVAFMDISGLPSALFVNIKVADIEPYYFTLMVNFLFIGLVVFLFLSFVCPKWKIGFTKIGLLDGLKKYGLIGLAVAIIGLVAFYVGLIPFDRKPSLAKVLVEGIIYYIGVAIIEELYIRGLLLNFIEKLFVKNKNDTLIAVVLSSVIFGLGHVFGMLNQPWYIIVCKVIWIIGMGLFLGTVYKKTNNLWLPIIFHFVINICALPYCFSNINGYAALTLYIIVPTYIILGLYSLVLLMRKDKEQVEKSKHSAA